MLKDRCSLIIKYLLNEKQPVNINLLMKKFSVSNRTIQYDLQNIDDWFQKNNLPLLKRKRNKGIEIVRDQAIRKKIKELFEIFDYYNYVYSPQERKYIILEMLFNVKKYITLADLANKLYVSKTTVFNDMSGVKKFLSANRIALNNKPNIGFYLEGEERNIRKVYSNLLWDIYCYYGTADIKDNISPLIIKVIAKWKELKFPIDILQSVDIDFIINCFIENLQNLKVAFTDRSFAKLCINAAVAVDRIMKGFNITLSDAQLNFAKGQSEFSYSEIIAKKLEAKFKINLSDSEIAQITVFILGMKIQGLQMQKNLSNLLNEGIVTTEAVIISSQIAGEVQNSLDIEIRNDENLILDLALHITSLLFRLRFELPGERNPILDDFKRNYPDIYKISKTAVKKVLNDLVGKSIEEDEIGFIAMHLGAAIYRAAQFDKAAKKIKVIIVCGTGLGTARLLTSRLKAEFHNIEIIAIEPYYNIRQNLSKYSYNLLISTVPLDDLGIKHILINPLLKYNDVLKLRQFLKGFSGNYNFPNMVKTLINEVSNTIDIDDIQKIQIEINIMKQLLQNNLSKQSKKIKSPRLIDLLEKNAIILNAKVKDWQEAIRYAGKPLVELGYITEDYIDDTIKNKENLGAYMMIDEGIAFPHAKPKKGVNKTCFSLLTLSKPVNFGNPDNDPIDIIILMATTNTWIHIEALSDIIKLLNSQDAKDRIRNAKHREEIIALLKDIDELDDLKQLFN